MSDFAAYGHAIVSIVVYALLSNVLSASVGSAKSKAGLTPGAMFEPASYDNPKWRLERTYQNTIEMGTFYIALTIAAILAGAPVFWVNLFASLGLIVRLIVVFVYLRGIGKGYMGVRTGLAICATALNFLTGLLTIFTVF